LNQEAALPYDQLLTQRIRLVLGERPGLIEKKLFGGVGFILHGNMACGVQGNSLIVRVGAEYNDEALSHPFVRPFMVTGGKPMAGWVLVDPGGLGTEGELAGWVERGYAYAQSLPSKE
jgi:TfoX/Sxy family transcriptional regulator of competence genes